MLQIWIRLHKRPANLNTHKQMLSRTAQSLRPHLAMAATTRMARPAAAIMAARSVSDSAKARALVRAKALTDESTTVPGWTSKVLDQGIASRRRHSTMAMAAATGPAEGLDDCINCYLSGGNLNALRVHSGAESSMFEAEQRQRLRYGNDIASLVLLASATAKHFSQKAERVGPPARRGGPSSREEAP